MTHPLADAVVIGDVLDGMQQQCEPNPAKPRAHAREDRDERECQRLAGGLGGGTGTHGSGLKMGIKG